MNRDSECHLWVWYRPCGIGGVETYLLNMAREAVKDGVEVWIAATTSIEGPLRTSLAQAGVQLLDWSGYHAAFMGKLPPRSVQDEIRIDIARIEPTLVALNDCNDFSIGAAPLLRRICPHCTILDTLHIDSPAEQYLEFRQMFVDVLDGIVATNTNILERFRRRFPGKKGVLSRYIANGATVKNRRRRPADETLRLLYVGRLVQDQKRILELPALLSDLRSRGKPFEMTIVGDGPQRDELAGELVARGLSGQVELLGVRTPEEVQDLYFEHDVLVNLSAFEGFSISVLESFAAGCVPVCTDIASLDSSVFRDGVNCRLCPLENLGGMVDIWFALTPADLGPLSAAAQTTGRYFSANRTYLEYRAFLAELRARRPLEPWPQDPGAEMTGEWDITRDNPWLARPHPVRKLADRVLRYLKRNRNKG